MEVTFPDGNKVEGKVDSDGNYHIQIPSDERFSGTTTDCKSC